MADGQMEDEMVGAKNLVADMGDDAEAIAAKKKSGEDGIIAILIG